MDKNVLYVLVGVAGLLFLVPGISTAADSIRAVLITNDSAHPVPTQAQGTTQVAGSVDVRTGPEARTPYQQTDFFNQTAQTCTQFVCTASFPAVPAGKRLVVTYASARYALSSGGTAPSVRLTDGNSPSNGTSILLPAPVNIGFDSWLAAGPVTFYVEAGQAPTLTLGGQFVQPVSNTAEVAISGYLVPTS
jgi:hypothetical protein